MSHKEHSKEASSHNQTKRKRTSNQNEGTNRNNIENSCGPQLEHAPNISEDESSHSDDNIPCLNDQSQMIALHYVLQLEKKYAKLGKDILKYVTTSAVGWLQNPMMLLVLHHS